jgi:voltage-gated potassium channel
MAQEALRQRVYHLLHADEQESASQKVARLTIASLIFLSLLVIVVASVPAIKQAHERAIDAIEATIIVVFAAEYTLRLWCITADPHYRHPILGRARYLISLMAIVDLIAILPIIAPEALPFGIVFVRSARLIVLLRVIKLGQYSHSMNTLIRVVKAKRHELGASMFVIVLLILCSSILVYYIENPTQPKEFSDVPASFWWAVATVTTVGAYSPYFPKTDAGKVCALFVSLLGVTAIALPSGIVATGLMEEYQKRNQVCPKCGSSIEKA